MRYEIYFYKNDTNMLMDQGKRAVELGAGKDWKIIYSGGIKKLLNIFVMSLLIMVAHSQPRSQVWVEKFEDPYERSYYPIANLDLNYTFKDSTSIQFTYWSNTSKEFFYYINFVLNWKSWSVSINPLKPDIYNYTIYITYAIDISRHRRRS